MDDQQPPLPSAGTATSSVDDLDTERASVLAAALRTSLLSSAISVTVFSALLFRTDPSGVVMWVGLRVLVTIACLTVLARLPAQPAGRRLHGMAWLMGVSGTVWGLLPAMIQPAEPQWQALLALWLFSTQTVVATVCRPDRVAFRAALGSVSVVSSVAFILRGDSFSLVLAGLVLLGGAYAVSMFAVTHRSTLAGLEQQHRAEGLALSLRVKQTALTAANAALDRLANTDTLTGLANRRGFMMALVDDGGCVTRPGWLAIIDLDGFKAINDSYGHPVGDEVLITAASRCQGVLADNMLGRTGGDEFAFVLPRHADAESIGQALLDQFDVPVQTYDDGLIRVGCSIGIGQFWPGEPLSEVMSRADRALYSAKAQGPGAVALDAQSNPSATDPSR